MIWYILISLLFAFLLWILLVPVIIYTHTGRNRYFLTLPGIFKAVLVPDDALFHIRGWVLFIPFKYRPFKHGRRKKGRKKEKNRNRKIKKRTWHSGNLRIMKGALSSFRIKRLEADIDTDDFTLNAWLVPVFSAVNGKKVQLQVNFEGHQSLLLDLRVTLGLLLWNILISKY
jgi:hypothetical protein